MNVNERLNSYITLTEIFCHATVSRASKMFYSLEAVEEIRAHNLLVAGQTSLPTAPISHRNTKMYLLGWGFVLAR